MSDGLTPNFSSRSAVSGGVRELLCGLPSQLGEIAALAIVTATSGSTYRKAGAMVLVGANHRRIGWLSGGCLEAELEAVAHRVMGEGRARHLCLDTRSDDDRVFGSASGCRGVIELMVYPIDYATPLRQALQTLAQGRALRLYLGRDGSGRAEDGEQVWHWPVAATEGNAADTAAAPLAPDWSLVLAPPPRIVLLGGGPETAPLLQLSRALGWQVDVIETRARWRATAGLADACHDMPAAAVAGWLAPQHFDAAVVMSHHFDADKRYLQACAQSRIAWIGLVGPPARRDALLAELDAVSVAALGPRLHGPAGMRLGGEGPEAIALSIVAALQRVVCGEP